MKKMITVGLSAAALCGVLAPVASAGFSDELDAADQVQRVANHRYGINPLVSCRSVSSRSFTCSVTDFKSDCTYEGRANVRKVNRYTYRVTRLRISKDCF